MKGKRYEGFSLIEILVVVALIIILAAITIIAINPAKNFRDTRDAQRASDVNAILNAVTQYTSEGGRSIASLETAAGGTEIATCTGDTIPQGTFIGTGAGEINLETVFVGENSADLMVEMPKDPSVDKNGTSTSTGYQICKTANGRVQVSAQAESGKTIAAKR